MSRSTQKVRKQVEIWTEDFVWYISTHNMGDDVNRTGFSHLVATLVKAYREVCESPLEFNIKTADLKSLTLSAAKHARQETE